MALEDRVQAQRLHVFRRAEELGRAGAAFSGRAWMDRRPVQ